MSMELWAPEQIRGDETSAALIEDVAKTAERVDSRRPFPADVVHRIEEKLLGERVHSSNAIEGSTLDLRETLMILREGLTAVRHKREAMEAHNLGQAARLIAEWVDRKDDEACHSADRLLRVHGLLLNGISDEWAGRFREQEVMIAGATHQPPDHTQVPALTKRAMEMLARPTDLSPVIRAAWVHWAIARIHPFVDGNGRMARLWQDLVLLQHGRTCGIIRPEDRRQYIEALSQADEGEFNPLIQLVAQRVLATFDKYLLGLGVAEDYEEFVTELAGEADARIEQQRKLAYQRWARKMEQVRWEFELCAARLAERSKAIRIQVKPYPIIDQTQWENLRKGLSVPNTWFFVVEFFAKSSRRGYIFSFGKHYWLDGLDNECDRAETQAGLIVSEQEGSEPAVRLDQLPDCPVTLRELFTTGEELIRKRSDLATKSLVYDRGVTPVQVAQDFFREVILQRLT